MKNNNNKKSSSGGFKSESFGFKSFGSDKKNDSRSKGGRGRDKSPSSSGSGYSINYSFGSSKDGEGSKDSSRGDRPRTGGDRSRSYGSRDGGSRSGGERKSYGDRSKKSFGDRPPRSGGGYGDRPRYSKDGDTNSEGSRSSSGERSSRSYGDRDRSKSYGSRDGGSRGDRSRSYGSRDGGSRSGGERKSYGDRSKKSFGDRPPRSGGGYGDRPRYSKDGDTSTESRSSSGERSSRSYGDRDRSKSYGSRDGGSRGDRSRSYGSRDGGSRSAGERKSYGDRSKKSFGDRPPRSGGGYGDRPRYSKDGDTSTESRSSSGERSSRSYGDRDRSKSYGSRDGGSRGDRSRSYGSRDGGSRSGGNRGGGRFGDRNKGKKSFGSRDMSSRNDKDSSTSSNSKSSMKIEKKDLQIEIENPKKDAYLIAVAYNIQTDFNRKCIYEAKDLPENIEGLDLEEGRLDLRELYTVTIDGDDSKDFDDAISVEKTENGYKLGIHIADVSHFVANGSALDREARTRGNSVYLIDKVFPMFPSELSNGICSLNEGVTRLTMSVFVEIDNKGEVLNSTFHNSAIRSARRLTYNYVQDVLDKKVDEADERLNSLITLSNEVKDILLKKRIDNGTIEFDLNETKVILDKNGEPTDFVDEKRKESHKIVEEFMLIANCEVASKLKNVEGAIYRVHGNPDVEKLVDFERIAYNLGYKLAKDNEGAYDFQSFMSSIKGKPEEKMLLTLLLRSMKQAVYDTTNIGHFGLGFSFYTHFTSPIRRYTDLLTHRLLKQNLEGLNSVSENTQKFYKSSADWCSKTERVAIECERDLFKVKACRYLKKYVGTEFDAHISGLTRFGIFAQIEEKGIEGLIRFADSSTYYEYDEENQIVVNKQLQIKYSMGDKIKIEVLRADIKGLFIDFTIKQ